MSQTQFLDELIKEYLLFRGFASTLKAFDHDLKSDKEKSFRVDKILEQILQHIANYDLQSLRELWGHLEGHMFCKLESHFTAGVKKLENSVLKLYLVNTVVNGKNEKMNEFFVKMTPELQSLPEWKEWFVLPYIKNPEDNPTFSLHFTKQWQDTLLISLHNFLSSIFQFMPTPTLMHFEDDALKISKLEQRNESLKARLTLLIDKGAETSVSACQVDPPSDLFDDFYIIAQESNVIDSQAKNLKSLLRNISTGSSPVMGRTEGARKRGLSSQRG